LFRHTGVVERPVRFEHNRYLGDKRSQVVYDVDELAEADADRIRELLESERFVCFGPDTLAEARNRGYRLWRRQRAAEASAGGGGSLRP
jgi:hypothetical protein